MTSSLIVKIDNDHLFLCTVGCYQLGLRLHADPDCRSTKLTALEMYSITDITVLRGKFYGHPGTVYKSVEVPFIHVANSGMSPTS